MPRFACQVMKNRHNNFANVFSPAQCDLLENLLDPVAHDRDCAEFRLNLARLENLRRKLREEYKRIARSRRDEGTAVATLARQIEILDLVHAHSAPTAGTGACYSDESNE